MRKDIIHRVLLFVELCLVIAVALFPFFRINNANALLVREHAFAAFVLIVGGAATVLMRMIQCSGAARTRGRAWFGSVFTRSSAVVLLLGGCIATCGVILALSEYPEWFLLPDTPYSASQRALAFGAVKVRFDANGGFCDEKVRICRFHDGYEGCMNLFPSEDYRYCIYYDKIRFNAATGCFSIEKENTTDAISSDGYYTTNAVPFVAPGEHWTYVIDMLDFKGAIKDWLVGQTWTTNHNSYTQFGLGRISGNITTGSYFCVISAMDYGRYNYMERAVIRTDPGQKYSARFRVALFAGTSVNESNYKYVKPGGIIACLLPVPTREGYAFDGWYDGQRLIVESSKVERRDEHVLTARWLKL